MMRIHSNKSTQCDESERNLHVNGTSEFSTDMVFKSRQDLMDWVQNVGRSLGYVVVTRRSKTKLSGGTSEVLLMCDRGGIYKSNKSSGRNTRSKKINCPFKLVGKYSKMYGFWTLRVICDKHNHEPTPLMEGHPYVRRLSDYEIRLVDELSRKNMKPQDILSTLKAQNPNNMSTLKTIYNALQKLRRTKHAETSKEQLINSEESASPNPLYTGHTFQANKSKTTIDHTDPFAIRNWVQEVESANYGSVTKDIEDLLFLREQMLMPCIRKVPSFQAKLMDTNSVKDVSNPNPVRDVEVMHDDCNCHDTNSPDADVIAISDVDLPTSVWPFQPYRDVDLNKPAEQFLEGDYVHGQSSAGKVGSGGDGGGGGRGRGSGQVGKEGEGESVEGSQTNTAVEPKNEDHKNVDIDVEVEKEHDKGEYFGVQSYSDMEENDSQSDANFYGLADIWKEMTIGLVSQKQMKKIHTNKSTQSDETERNLYVNGTSEFSTDMVFMSRQDLMDWVQNVGRSLGYVVVTKRSKTKPSGCTSKVILKCDRGGIYTSKKSSSRNTRSRKINCPFELVAKYLKMYGVWTLIVICDKHNHEPAAAHMEGHPYVMRLSDYETRLVDELSRKNMKPQDILSTLKAQNPNNLSTLKTIYNARQKIRRTKHAETSKGQLINSEEGASPSQLYTGHAFDENKSKGTIDHTDQFASRNWVQETESAIYGSVTKDIEGLLFLREQMLMPCFRRFPSFQANLMETNPAKDVSNPNPVRDVVMRDEGNGHDPNAPDADVIAISDVDIPTSARPFQPYRDVDLNKPEGQFLMEQFLEGDYVHGQSSAGKGEGGESVEGSETNAAAEPENEEHKNVDTDVEFEKKHDKDEYAGVLSDSDMEGNDSQSDVSFDGLADIWKEMAIGLETSKDAAMDLPINKHKKEDEEECDHSFILKEDIGYVCRVCGVIERSIASIIEFQHPKSSRSTRSYYEGRSDKSGESGVAVLDGVKSPGKDFSVVDISPHPMHKKQMKPHQVEGFNFLTSNLVSENPGGCILAHAPGSGKTFMLISFIQSFMAKYPDARPLVVLPRGILPTWKKEFKRWQVENMPLFDFYSAKADNRAQQVEVLTEWASTRSILFLGYKQFSSIVCDNDRSLVAITRQKILLTYPSILILDEGHTPRNRYTDVFTSVEKIQTPRKVVLSGTLYQNHVMEVFNILNLVRPKFLRMGDSKMIKRRILSRVPIESRRNLFLRSTENDFYELVEHTLLKDENFKRKMTVIEDLREMTSKVLHYYKGDFLDELLGHMDFSVFLKLSPRQEREVHELNTLVRKFKVSSDGSVIYVHPELKSLLRTVSNDRNDDNIFNKIDELLENLDESEGVKAKFFLNLLRLCEFSGEKLLVFGNYLLPLYFLLRLTMKVKGWHLGKEIFMIAGYHGNDERELAMDQFNNSSDAKVFFGSIKACGEGISLVGASRVIILDVHLNPSVTRQAIGRAFRPGQVRKVYTYRLIAANSPEEEDHARCFRKESIAKMWFELNEYSGHHEFEMETIDVKDCGDQFLETPWLNEDVAALSKRS